VFRPRLGNEGDQGEVAKGLEAAPRVLDALEALAAENAWLVGLSLSLADLHLGAMMAYFTPSPRGAALLSTRKRLASWWRKIGARPSMTATDPGLPVTQA
jgi:glutathione S-transferase